MVQYRTNLTNIKDLDEFRGCSKDLSCSNCISVSLITDKMLMVYWSMLSLFKATDVVSLITAVSMEERSHRQPYSLAVVIQDSTFLQEERLWIYSWGTR
jgi:predicted transcriptional regulator of viral defense system